MRCAREDVAGDPIRIDSSVVAEESVSMHSESRLRVPNSASISVGTSSIPFGEEREEVVVVEEEEEEEGMSVMTAEQQCKSVTDDPDARNNVIHAE
jgi:hypothetical protein